MPITQAGKCPICRTCDDSYKVKQVISQDDQDISDEDAQDALYTSLMDMIQDSQININNIDILTPNQLQRYNAYLDNMRSYVECNATFDDMRRLDDELGHWYHAIINYH
jgi:hypothetical protein